MADADRRRTNSTPKGTPMPTGAELFRIRQAKKNVVSVPVDAQSMGARDWILFNKLKQRKRDRGRHLTKAEKFGSPTVAYTIQGDSTICNLVWTSKEGNQLLTFISTGVATRQHPDEWNDDIGKVNAFREAIRNSTKLVLVSVQDYK